jgi:minor extracellular serine protease Vpr
MKLVIRLILLTAFLCAVVSLRQLSANSQNTTSGSPKATGGRSWTAAPANIKGHVFRPALAPHGLAAGAGKAAVKAPLVTVIVELAGDPVAVQATKALVPMTSTEETSAAAALSRSQQGVASQIQALGGTIHGSYQHAYNGIRVRIAADKLPALAALNNVIGVHPVVVHKPVNIHGVPLIGAPQAWAGFAGTPGVTGHGLKIAVIDTGIDYTHADFGGPGTPEAYQAALANDTAPPDPALFGPGAPKVKGGTDLVGDDYNADPNSPSYQPVPHPDLNPLDCNGHGTHTSGTATGFGVLADGTRFAGPYDADTVSGHSWLVGPGVAPEADLYAVRVFGCEGSTDVVVDAIEWAVTNHMDVINMSLGSDFGPPDSPDAKASTNAAKGGVIVVTSAGNAGPAPYIVGTPSVADGILSVAALDPTQSFPAANIHLSTGVPDITAIEANGISTSGLGEIPVNVLFNGTPHDPAHISLGCDPDEYTADSVAGDLAVVKRGTCARVARAIFGQQAGAAAVLMINNSAGFPPFEGQITSNPDTGEPFTVTIPFLGVPGTPANSQAFVDADLAGGTATFSDTTLTNPGFLAPASFSSGGPRGPDSFLKPNLIAPGVSIFSAGMGTGTGAAVLSGTSMASPHTAGAAALVRQAHSDWRKVQYWNAALVNTADPDLVTPYSTQISGAGLVQVQKAVATNVVAFADNKNTELNFGYAELQHDFQKNLNVKLHNFGGTPVTFNISKVNEAGVPHNLALNQSQITVNPGADKNVQVTLTVPASTAGDSSAFNSASGLVRFTPVAGGNNGVRLDVPWLFVPQEVSNINTDIDLGQLRRNGSATARVRNHGPGTGTADWYAWGLSDSGGDHGVGSADVQNVGVQTFPADGVLAFAINTKTPWANAAQNEYDIMLDLDGDGNPDYLVVGADLGALTAGVNNGTMATAVFNLSTGEGSIEFLADAPFNSSTLVLPVLFSQLCNAGSPCLSSSTPRFTYTAQAFNLAAGGTDIVNGTASFNAFTPAVSTGMFDVVPGGGTVNETVSVNSAEFAITPPRGFMILSHDNKSDQEAQTIRFRN